MTSPCDKAPNSVEAESLIEDKLPDELLSLVFVHLSPGEAISGPARVCRRWQQACLRPSVWAERIGFRMLCLDRAGDWGRWTLPRLYNVIQASNLLALPDQSSSGFPHLICRHKRLQTSITPGLTLFLAGGCATLMCPAKRKGALCCGPKYELSVLCSRSPAELEKHRLSGITGQSHNLQFAWFVMNII